MNTLVSGVVEIAKSLQQECGEFAVFALLARNNATVFDIVVSANWIDSGEFAGVKVVSERVLKLPWDLLMQISGVVAVSTDSEFVRDFLELHGEVTKPIAIGETWYGDVHVIRGYVLSTAPQVVLTYT